MLQRGLNLMKGESSVGGRRNVDKVRPLSPTRNEEVVLGKVGQKVSGPNFKPLGRNQLGVLVRPS